MSTPVSVKAIVMLVLIALAAKSENSEERYSPWKSVAATPALIAHYLSCTDQFAHGSVSLGGDVLTYQVSAQMVVQLDSKNSTIAFLTPFYSGSIPFSKLNKIQSEAISEADINQSCRKEWGCTGVRLPANNDMYSYRISFQGSIKSGDLTDVYELGFEQASAGLSSNGPCLFPCRKRRGISLVQKINMKAQDVEMKELMWPDDMKPSKNDFAVQNSLSSAVSVVAFFENYQLSISEGIPVSKNCPGECVPKSRPIRKQTLKSEIDSLSKKIPKCSSFARSTRDKRFLRAIERVEKLVAEARSKT